MTTMVCSGWSPSGRMQYGERFLASFHRWAAPDVALGVWVEQPHVMPRGALRDLWAIPGAKMFHMEHCGRPEAQGRVPRDGWKSSERLKGYSFKFDAAKFWKQILIPNAAAGELADGDVLVWFDGDVQFHQKFSAATIDGLLGDAQVAFLGRGPYHSEIGFWAIRLDDVTRSFLVAIADVYTSGEVFNLREWHSAFVWDHVRKGMAMKERNLCAEGARGHVWPVSPLAAFCMHNKGLRKGFGQ